MALPEIVKVCGITNAGDARFAVEGGATAVGFIFYQGSPRYVTPQDAAMIAATLPKTLLRVGVFVDEQPARIRMIASLARLDVVQLHGARLDEQLAEESSLLNRGLPTVAVLAAVSPLLGLRGWTPSSRKNA